MDKTSLVLKRDELGRVRTPRERRAMLVGEFQRSGLPASKFAQLAGVRYNSIRHPGSRVEGVECETWDVTASHVYGQDLIGIEAG